MERLAEGLSGKTHGFELEAPYSGTGEVIGSTTPAGTVATAVHFGPYEQLVDAHQAIRDWCEDGGYSLAGPNWEIYAHWRDEWKSAPEEIRTDVYYLIKTAGS